MAPGPRRATERRSAARDRVVGRLRRICMALPEASEKVSHGEPTWFAGKGKVFAMLDDHHHGAAHLSVWLPQPIGAQEALIGTDPERFFRPPYVGVRGWVGVVLDTDPDWNQVARLVRDAYLSVATAKLRKLAASPSRAGSARSRRRTRPQVAPAFVLIPGAGGVAWYWHRVVPLIEREKHEAIAVDLPGDDERAGLSVYAERVIDAIGARRDVVLVAQSLGGFTVPLVCARVRVRMLVFVNAMIPIPGESPGEWWDNTGWDAARTAAARRGGYGATFDLATYFLHDVPRETVKRGEARDRPEADVVFRDRCRFRAWPHVPIHAIAGRDDRFFPIAFQRRVARERLHVAVDALPGGHLIALSNPHGLADTILGYVRPRRRAPRRASARAGDD